MPRDIIISINGKEVSDPKEVKEMISDDTLKDGVRFIVETQGMQRFVMVQSSNGLEGEDSEE